MSIQSEIERIAAAKENIAQAIAQKGVNIPEAASLSDMPELISEIPERGAVNWEEIENKPEEYPPASHNHNDLYYTASQTDIKIAEAVAAVTNAETVDGKHVVVSDTVPTVNDINIITFVV